MKTSRRLAGLLLAIVMLFTLAVGVSAAGKGTITISNAVVGQTYTIYRILDLESHNPTTGAYSYKANSAWKGFVESAAIKDVYLTTEAGYVTWVAAQDPDTVQAFAKAAQKYAVDNNISATKSENAASEDKDAETTTVVFENLDLGYYLVDTTLGTLCSINTTNPEAEITEKNSVPTIDKEVKEDSDNKYGKENTAQIGDTVEFRTTVHAKKGAAGYVIHDEMSDGLTLNRDSVKVADAAEGTDYTVAFDVVHKDDENNKEKITSICDFEITFTKAYLDKITEDTDIIVTYSAILNDKAVISTDANTNKTKLDYGDNSGSSTEWAETETKTFKFDLVKTNSDNEILNGAKFELYDAQTGGNKIALVKEADGSYRIATADEKKVEGFESAVIEAGSVTAKGLDADTAYWIEEIQQPEGYNKLAERVAVNMGDANLTATIENGKWTAGGVHVVNNTGAELPSTGGIGTTIFYIVGAVLVLGASVLLVTKRRMNNDQ